MGNIYDILNFCILISFKLQLQDILSTFHTGEHSSGAPQIICHTFKIALYQMRSAGTRTSQTINTS